MKSSKRIFSMLLALLIPMSFLLSFSAMAAPAITMQPWEAFAGEAYGYQAKAYFG